MRSKKRMIPALVSVTQAAVLCAVGGCEPAGHPSAQTRAAVEASEARLGRVVFQLPDRLRIYSLDTGVSTELGPFPDAGKALRLIAVGPSLKVVSVVTSLDQAGTVHLYGPSLEKMGSVRFGGGGIVDVGCCSQEPSLCVLCADGSLYTASLAHPQIGAVRVGALPDKPVRFNRFGLARAPGTVGVELPDRTWTFDLSTEEWSRCPTTGYLQDAAGSLYFLLRDGRLHKSDPRFSDTANPVDPKEAYSFAHGFVVREDGQYVIYDRPKAHGRRGYEWVLVPTGGGAERVLGDLGAFEEVIRWVAPAEGR